MKIKKIICAIGFIIINTSIMSASVRDTIYNRITFDVAMGFDASNVHEKTPFTLELMVGEQVYISSNLFFGFQGGWNYLNLSNKDMDYKSSMHTLKIVPMLGLTIGNQSKVNLSFGPSGSLLIGYRFKQKLGDDMYYEYKYKDMESSLYKELVIGLKFGVELDVPNIPAIGIFYNMSLTEHFQDVTEHQITFRIPIVLYKEASKRANL